jgi:hypothetical protein
MSRFRSPALLQRLSLLTNLTRDLFERLFCAYRPELHYMRGPGPRWREKRALASPDTPFRHHSV